MFYNWNISKSFNTNNFRILNMYKIRINFKKLDEYIWLRDNLIFKKK